MSKRNAEKRTVTIPGPFTSFFDEYLPAEMADAPEDGSQPPLPAVVKALDANGDGVIDADEIANAPTALRALDKNGDDKLTMDELMGSPPRGFGGPPPDNQN